MTLRPSQRQTYAHVGPAVVRLTVSPSAANVKAQGNTRFQHRHPYPRISAYAKGIGWVAGRRDLTNTFCIRDRKSTRLNSSHGYISYAVFCLKKKKKK